MGKWLVTVNDGDDNRMQEIANTVNPVWVKAWAGDAVEVQDMQKMEEN